MNLIQLFKAIANAIRTKLGTSAPINAEDFPTQIGNISTGVDTSDANATASDIKTGKTAYVNGQKITGNFAGIIPTGTKSITTNGTHDVTNYASADVNVASTPNVTTVTTSYTTTSTPRGGNVSGFIEELSVKMTQPGCIYLFYQFNKLVDLTIEFTVKPTKMTSMFFGCYALKNLTLINLDTSDVTEMSNMFVDCNNLEDIPLLNTSSVTGMVSMFSGCNSLTNESLDKVLQMCIGATSYAKTKTLNYLGLQSWMYSAATIQALPHYQAFINAGWTIGY